MNFRIYRKNSQRGICIYLSYIFPRCYSHRPASWGTEQGGEVGSEACTAHSTSLQLTNTLISGIFYSYVSKRWGIIYPFFLIWVRSEYFEIRDNFILFCVVSILNLPLLHIYFFTFYFEMISDLQKSCKNCEK